MYATFAASMSTYTDMANIVDIEDCGPLPNIPNGRVELDPNTLENSTASYICDEGYDLIGDMSRTCQRQNAMWSGTEPTCTSKSLALYRVRSILAYRNDFHQTNSNTEVLTTGIRWLQTLNLLVAIMQARGITLVLTAILIMQS